MQRDLTPEEEAYSKRLFDAVLDTVATLDAVPGTEAGYVRPDIVRIALLDVVATVDFNCGLGRMPSERRSTGEMLGKRYASLLKGLIENSAMASWPQAQRVQ